jgi:lipopolysaccharide transport system permease protein
MQRPGTEDDAAIVHPVSAVTSPPSVVIERRRSYSLRLDELWAYRELFYFLMWRDVKVRYKQTALGAAWAVLQPLLLMVVFTIFLGQLAGVGPPGIPYPIFAFSALVPWMFFSNGLAASANSLVGSANLVSKIYFPRILAPVAAACSFLLDFAISFVVLLLLMAVYRIPPEPSVVLLPVFAGYVVAVTIGAGMLLSALNVRYRDVRYALPFLIQLWLFATPVAYQFDVVGSQYRLIFALNPMVTGIGGFRSALLGTGGVPIEVLAISTLSAVVLVVAGFLYFRRVERTFADVI